MLNKNNIIFLFFILGIVLTIYFLLNGTPWVKWITKVRTESYLDEKYKQEMVVDHVEYDFKNDSYYSVAYPKDNPDIRFISTTHSDNYLSRKLKRKINTDLREFVKEQYGEMGSGWNEIPAIPDEIEKKYVNREISYNEIKDKLKTFGEIKIVIIMEKIFNYENEDIKYMYRIIKFIDKKRLEPDVITFSFSNGNMKEMDLWKTFEFNDNDINKINSWEDLKEILLF
ncbi:MAG: hypothetical protein H0Z33_15450 [Bacillaceae bacterium]|nr:hypothetical protein [Bacillaceae bacterium]